MNRKIQFSLVATTAIAAVLSNPAYAQQSRPDGGSSVSDLENPTYDANTSLGVVTGDNLGNHIADGELNMNGFAIFNMGDPVDPMDGVSLQYLQDYVTANGDNLGNHTATTVLNMGGFAITQLPAPTGPTHAANRAYVDTAVAGAGDDLGNHTATESLDMNGHRITRLDDPENGRDAVPFSFLEQYVTDNGDHLGNHIATQDLDMKDFKVLNVMDPTEDKDATNKLYVDGLISGIDDSIDDLEAIEIIAGTGLTGGGDLTQNRTISFSTTWGDNRYALRSRAVNAGTGLTGGGNLAANRTISLNLSYGDNRWINRTANATISGTKTFTGPVIVNTPTINNHAANKAYVDSTANSAIDSLIAGDGLTKTGRTFAVDNTVVRTSGNQVINGAKTFSQIRHFADSNVANGSARFGRSTSQYIDFHGGSSGNFITSVSSQANNKALHLRLQNGALTHNFTFLSDGRIANVATPTAASDAANKAYVDAAAANAVGTTYTSGTGLDLTGTQFSFDTTFGDERYAEHVDVTGASNYDSVLGGTTASGARTFHHSMGGAPADAPTTEQQVGIRLGSPWGRTDVAFPNNDDVNRGFFRTGNSVNWAEIVSSENIGSFVAANETTYTAGTGLTLTGGQFQFNTAWGDGRYALRGRSLTAGDGLTGGGTLAANRTFSVDGSVVRTSRSIATGTGLSGGGNLSANRTFSVDNTVFRTGLAVAGNLRFASANGRGLRFFDNDNYKIYMSSIGDSTWGGRLDSASDYNMYFRMAGGTSRGFVFKNANNAIFQISGNGTAYANGGYRSSGDTGWFNQTHGGGWYMQDSTWIRTYNDKNIFTGGQLRADAGVMVGSTLSIGSNGRLNAANRQIINVATPTAGTHAANKSYVDARLSAQPDADTTYTAGTGLVESSQVFSFDISWGDARYAQRGRVLTAGDGLTGGGNLASNRTFAVDSSVVRTSRAVSAGTGLSGGGNLGANRTISFNTSWGDGRYALRGRNIAAGTGLSGGGNLAANRTLSFNTTWGDTRYSQHGMLAGGTYDSQMGGTTTAEAQTFYHSQGSSPSDAPVNAQHVGMRLGSPWGRTDMAFPNDAGGLNRAFFRTGTSTAWSEIVTNDNIGSMIGAGTGLTKSGNTLSFNAAWGDGRYALRGRNLAAGDGLTGGGNLAANRSFAVDSSVVRTARSLTAGTGLTGGGNLGANRTFSVDGSVFRTGAAIAGNLRFAADDGRGMRFWDSDNYKIYMSSQANGTWGGRLDAATDYNMYFRMAGGNRGFVFKNGNNPVFQIDGNGQLHGANGRIQTPDAFVTTNSSGVRMVSGNYGAFWHQNGSHLYLMMTNSGNQYGSYNGLRPFYVSLADGKVNMRQGLDMGGGRINNVATPAAATDVANKAYVDSQSGPSYAAGTGISISGTTVSFNTAWGDGRYALRGRTIGTGSGLTGGGNLAANRTLSVDGTVIRTTGNQSMSGVKTLTGELRILHNSSAPSTKMRLGRSTSQYMTFHGSATGNFMTGVSPSGNNKPIILRPQSGGVSHNFIFSTNGRISGVATPAAATDVANKAYVDSQAGSTYAAGTGISISGTTVSFNTSWGDGRYALRGRTIGTGLGLTGGGNLTANRQISLRPEYQRHQAQTNAVGLLAYNGHNRTAGQLYGGGTNPASTVRLNYDGSLYATRFYSTAYYYFSDRTLKKDIETIDAETGMGIVRDLRPVSYAWRQNDQKALGVIAQEVEEIIPTAVTTNEEGLKAVDYIQMIAPMLAAIQELDERVQVLEAAAN